MDRPVNTLTRENWIDFALQRLTEEGIDKVTITGLARELSVTKGSFYWHFKDRDDLLQAMLTRWEETGSKLVFGEVERVGGDAVRRLKHLSDIIIRRYADQLNLEEAQAELAEANARVTTSDGDKKAVERAKQIASAKVALASSKSTSGTHA